MSTYIYMFTHTLYIHTYIHTYIYTYIHTYTCTCCSYTHTHTWWSILSFTTCLQLLVEEGANVNLADRYGDTPLHGALRHYTMTTIKQLHATNQNVAKVKYLYMCMHHQLSADYLVTNLILWKMNVRICLTRYYETLRCKTSQWDLIYKMTVCVCMYET